MSGISYPDPLVVLLKAAADPRLGDGECVMLIVLYQHHSKLMVKDVSHAEMATLLGVSKRTVSSRVSVLVRTGYIKQFSRGRRISYSYHLCCFAPGFRLKSESTPLESKKPASPIVDEAVEREDIPLRECPPSPSTSTKTKSIEGFCDETPSFSPCLGLTEEVHEYIRFHRGIHVKKILRSLLSHEDENVAKEMILAQRYAISIGRLDSYSDVFLKQVQAIRSSGTINRPEVLETLRANCEVRLAIPNLGKAHRRMAELELQFIDEVLVRIGGERPDA